MSTRFYIYTALTVVIAVLLIFYSRSIATWIVDAVSAPPPSRGAPVGQLAEVIGEVYLRSGSAQARIENTPAAIYQNDVVIVNTGSLARG